MPVTEFPDHHLRQLTSEISRLSKQQNDALRRAAFEGMTKDEAEECEGRRTQIGELVKELALITSEKAA